MNKRKLHHLWVKLRPVSYWYFLIVFIVAGLIAISALRQNNLEMVRLREAVHTADESGEGVEEALQTLRKHVYSHMNTDLTSGDNAIHPPIQLAKTYERLVAGERARVATTNEKVSADAVRICEARFPAGQIQARAQCVQEYITQNSATERQVVPKELYQYDFVSPFWSPDLAGWSILVSAVFFMLFILRFSLERWLKTQLD